MFALIILAFGVILVLVGGFLLMRGTPDYYAGHRLSPAQQAAAAGSAEDKFRQILNSAGMAHRDAALARQAARSGTTQATTAPAPIVVSFTDDELNSVFQKWAELNNWKANYQRYFNDPVVVFQRDRIILAARVASSDINSVVSIHLKPELMPDGQMQLKLERALAGRLPLPTGMFQKYLDKAVDALRQRLPQWQNEAQIADTGEVNNAAISAQLAKLAIASLHQQPADGTVFLPTTGKANVPVKVVGVDIEDKSIQLSLQPLTSDERNALLERIKSPLVTETASSN
ncbi:MAG TPA: hypothetical protein VL282_07715 [Tepidisphaeraceae bacterium]|nr:hypothetical protein [Tepidisphaeraceae bacterium]